jgi:hypothetical protein
MHAGPADVPGHLPISRAVLHEGRTHIGSFRDSQGGFWSSSREALPSRTRFLLRRGYALKEYAMSPPIPTELLDPFAGPGGIALGVAWFVVQLTKAIVPPAVDHLSKRRVLQTIERLADTSPPARIELTPEGFMFDPRPPDRPSRLEMVLIENVPDMPREQPARQAQARGDPRSPRVRIRLPSLKPAAVEPKGRMPP